MPDRRVGRRERKKKACSLSFSVMTEGRLTQTGLLDWLSGSEWIHMSTSVNSSTVTGNNTSRVLSLKVLPCVDSAAVEPPLITTFDGLYTAEVSLHPHQ